MEAFRTSNNYFAHAALNRNDEALYEKSIQVHLVGKEKEAKAQDTSASTSSSNSQSRADFHRTWLTFVNQHFPNGVGGR